MTTTTTREDVYAALDAMYAAERLLGKATNGTHAEQVAAQVTRDDAFQAYHSALSTYAERR